MMEKTRAIPISHQIVEACGFALLAVSFFMLALIFLSTLFLVGHFWTYLTK